ncbi:MAG: hypothetical protein PVH52_04600 [bacterium]|jgi:hypothetical protein
MSDFRMNDDGEWASMAAGIRNSPLPEVRKLAQAFGWVTNRIITHAETEVETARALRDEESAVRQQVKMETIRHARSVFEECYLLATGRKAWDE